MQLLIFIQISIKYVVMCKIYRSILHQLAIDENWNNVYSGITLPSGDMGAIKVERVDDERESKGV